MQTEPSITWRDIPHSEAIDEIIRTRIAALERFRQGIIGCHVVVSAPQNRHRTARGFDVRIHVQVPGPDIDVARGVRQGQAADDLKLAVNAAFNAVEKQLKEHKRVQTALEVKHHAPTLHGEIIELESSLGYGFLRADDGKEVYFQRDSLVAGDWNSLHTGDRLRFREMDGEKGPFAVDIAPSD